MDWLALDVGGANLKAADGVGFARSRPFPIWRAPDQLTAQLREMLAAAPAYDQLAVTMTAELADCFVSKSQGVRAIVDAVRSAADGCPVWIYLTTGEFADSDTACESPLLAAASNWHALAAFAARYCMGESGLMIDVGSTTSDVIPIVDGHPAAVGKTDPERLIGGELVYCGVDRTPIAALVERLPYRSVEVPVAAELFATTADAYLLLGEIAEEPENCDTADARPRTSAASRARIARMICSDVHDVTLQDATAMAAAVRCAQRDRIEAACRAVIANMPSPLETIILSGQGEFLGRQVVQQLRSRCRVLSLTNELGPEISRCAPAHALARLARERRPA